MHERALKTLNCSPKVRSYYQAALISSLTGTGRPHPLSQPAPGSLAVLNKSSDFCQPGGYKVSLPPPTSDPHKLAMGVFTTLTLRQKETCLKSQTVGPMDQAICHLSPPFFLRSFQGSLSASPGVSLTYKAVQHLVDEAGWSSPTAFSSRFRLTSLLENIS